MVIAADLLYRRQVAVMTIKAVTATVRMNPTKTTVLAIIMTSSTKKNGCK